MMILQIRYACCYCIMRSNDFFSPSFFNIFILLSPQLTHIIPSSLITIDVVQLEMEDNDLIDVVVVVYRL